MGIVYRGLPFEAATKLKDEHGIELLIETGTHVGKTAVEAAKIFKRVITIESNEIYLKRARGACKYIRNVTILSGQSEVLLPNLLGSLEAPAMIWLDAHWSRDLKGQKPDTVCPVLAELAAINQNDLGHIILIDDARLFGTSGWPSMASVLESLNGQPRKVWQSDDVIFAVPEPGGAIG